MAESHVISALVEKRSELAGLLSHYHKEILRISEELKTLDATIKIFNPEYPTEAIRPKRYQRKNKFFKNGESRRLILDSLRDSQEPISAHDIALAVISSKGFDANSIKPLQASLLSVLHKQRKEGLVELASKDSKGNCLWRILA